MEQKRSEMSKERKPVENLNKLKPLSLEEINNAIPLCEGADYFMAFFAGVRFAEEHYRIKKQK